MYRDPHRFLDELRTQSPATLEEDALQCPDDTRASYRFAAAAERIFLRDSCEAVVKMLQQPVTKRILHLPATYTARWNLIIDCLPKQTHPGSSADTFYAAQREELDGNKVAALKLYLEASVKHPLAATRAACLGGRGRRLAGWRRYTGNIDPLVLGLQFQALMLDKLGIALLGETRTYRARFLRGGTHHIATALTEEERTHHISEADWQVGLLAGRLSVLFGCLETALYLLAVLGEEGHLLTLPYVAYASGNNIHAAAYIRGLFARCAKVGASPPVALEWERHEEFFVAEGQYVAYPWAALPFCYAPRPANLFASNCAIDLAADVLQKVHTPHGPPILPILPG